MKKIKFFPILIIFSFITAAFGYTTTSDIMNYSPGNYNQNIFISINDLIPGEDIYYTFDDQIDLPDVKYQGGFLLSALPGEERIYNLKISMSGEVKDYSFLIDKKPPAKASLKYLENENSLQGFIFENIDADAQLFYGYDSPDRNSIKIWDGETLYRSENNILFYYTEDSAGNKSEYSILYPDEKTKQETRPSLKIKSPVEGSFANTQILFIDRSGFEWIKYTLNGSDPTIYGVEYTDPVEIRRYGKVYLRVSAKLPGTEQVITKEVSYQVNTKAPLKNMPDSGIYSGSVNIKGSFDNFRYCLDERKPEISDQLFSGQIVINPILGGVKYSTLRLSNFDDPEGSEYRYFYIIDDRYPATPLIKIADKLPVNKDVEVIINGPDYSKIYYTLDGTTPGKSSLLYREPIKLEVPEGRTAGSIIVKARSISLNNKTSDVVSKFITYDTFPPEKPEISFIQEPESGRFVLNYNKEDNSELFYSCIEKQGSGTDIVYADMQPVEPEKFMIHVPEGMEKVFTFIFAAKDAAGNWSAPSNPVSLNLDRKAPAAAEMHIENETIHFESNCKVKYVYKIVENGKIIHTAEGVYDEPLSIIKELTPGHSLIINTATTDDSGNTVLSAHTFTNDKFSQDSEAFLVKNNENIFSGNEVEFYAHPDNIDEHLIYYLTVLESDGTESTAGPFATDGNITIEGEEGKELDYLLEVYSVNETTSERSSVISYNFKIDNIKPAIPKIKGLPANDVSNVKVYLSPVSDGNSIVFLSYADEPEGLEPFSTKSIIFNKRTAFDAQNGVERNYYLRLGAEDSAGNRSRNDEIYHFKVDKKPPEVFIEKNDEPLSIRISSNEPAYFYYEYGPAGSIIRTPDEKSDSVEEVINIGEMNLKDGTYIFKISAVDIAGNICKTPRVCSLKIDNSLIEPPGEPVVKIFDRLGKLSIAWKNSQSNIFYKIDYGTEDDNKDFTQYAAPFSLKTSEINNRITIRYFKQDNSGKKSREQSVSIAIPSTKNKILAEGITNGTSHNSDQRLVLTDKSKLIRYEITTEAFVTPEVNVFSPQLTDELNFKTEKGESIDFTVSLKEFSDQTDVKGGAEQVIRFSIDKQAPIPPEIQGIEDKEYYLTDRTVFFSALNDDIYYKIGMSRESAQAYKKYTEPFIISSDGGTYQSYYISAYSEDKAGNRSIIETWEITIDKEVIYVSNNGRDYSQGTRSQPFKTLEKAIDQVKSSERKTIFIAEGIYEISSTIVIDETISLYGGFKNGNWFDKDQKTVIVLHDKFANEKPVFYIYGGKLNFSNIDISPSSDSYNSFFFLNKGDLNINSCNIEADCIGTANLILQNYGNLSINDSDISGIASSSPFIHLDYGNLRINNSSISVDGNSDQTVLVSSNNSINFEITGSRILPGKGKNIKALQLSNSRATLRNNTIFSGNGSISASAIYVTDSKLSMSYNKINSDIGSRITTGIRSVNSQLTFNANKIDISAQAGIIGFNINGGSSLIYNNTITSGHCTDFSYLYRLESGKHSIETNIIKMKPADEMLMLRNIDSDLDFLNNTLVSESGQGRNILFEAEGSSVTRIINNILINNDAGADNTILQLHKDNLLSFKNNMVYGWTNYAKGNETASDIISLDLIDGIYSAGRISGNIEENPSITFTDDGNYNLSAESRCIDSGYDLSDIINFRFDINGDPRPNKDIGERPIFDIGADEYYAD